jgi:hypothetical protein
MPWTWVRQPKITAKKNETKKLISEEFGVVKMPSTEPWEKRSKYNKIFIGNRK